MGEKKGKLRDTLRLPAGGLLLHLHSIPAPAENPGGPCSVMAAKAASAASQNLVVNPLSPTPPEASA